ncbi:A24 family peptidase [Sanguibacter sp. HDW7]|uniref:prepilin peptidase n=1 Tax=Sanguibacter sp. HDW7 TaxID=2714931 RepID=UPI00140B6CD5|nr:A24 family peptidase [Sanguibacter sp. HDW7]QIK83579.1 prepilin peptidase [Sanguibacter sp. HDW7]
MIYLYILVALLGLAIGSFLNVVIWRVPRGESVVSPPSACPRCGHAIRAGDNVPVLSWILLRARCRDCGEPISVRYPVVEAATGVLFVLVLARFGVTVELAAFLLVAGVALALTLIDLDTRRLPDVLTLGVVPVLVALLAVASAVSGDWTALWRALAGGAALFTFYFVLLLIYPSGMGFGDVKFALSLGLVMGYVGWGTLVVGAFAAFLLGGVLSIALLATGKATRKSGLPFGPWMAAGAAVGIGFGEQIAHAYLSLLV